MALDQSIQNESRHAVFIQRYAGGLAKDFEPYLTQLRKEISFRLNNEDQTAFNRTRLNIMLRELRQIQRDIYGEYTNDLFEQLELFTDHEIDFELESLDDVMITESVSLAKPAPAQVWAAARANPLVFPNSDDVVLLQPFVNGWTRQEINRVNGIIQTGFATGETNAQIAQRISGKGGTLDTVTRRNNRTIVRTATNHVSAIARERAMRENDDIVTGYEWVSALDSRTSSQCKSLDGQVFKWNDSYRPQPPIHPNCRSSTVPVLDQRFSLDDSTEARASKGDEGGQQIAADTTYYSFLKKQSAAFQDDTLGKTRGKLFRNGGLTPDEFARLNVDQKFRPLTLEEMREKNPLAFERANLS